jgi:hypothetical protein
VMFGEDRRTPRGGGDGCVWSNGGIMISRGKPKNLKKKPVLMPLCPPRISQVALD